jgi:hypothetical protein
MTVGFECVGDCRVATHFRRVEYYANKPKLFAGVKECCKPNEMKGPPPPSKGELKVTFVSFFFNWLLATRLLWNYSLLLLIYNLKCLVRESRALLFVQSLTALREAHWRLWTSRRTSCRHHRLFWLFSSFPAVCVRAPPSDAMGAIHHARPWQDARRI